MTLLIKLTNLIIFIDTDIHFGYSLVYWLEHKVFIRGITLLENEPLLWKRN